MFGKFSQLSCKAGLFMTNGGQTEKKDPKKKDVEVEEGPLCMM